MDAETLVRLVTRALMLALVLSLPALGGALAAELAAWVAERTTGRSLSAAQPVLRLLGVAAALALAAPWIGQQLLQYAGLALLSLGNAGGAPDAAP